MASSLHSDKEAELDALALAIEESVAENSK
jgi:hypothetical protein